MHASLSSFPSALLSVFAIIFFSSVLLSLISPLSFLLVVSYHNIDCKGAAGGCTSRVDQLNDFLNLPHFPFVQFFKQYCNRLDGEQFSATGLSCDVSESCGLHTARLGDIAVESWIKRWWHCEGHVTTHSSCRCTCTDGLYVRYFKAVW